MTVISEPETVVLRYLDRLVAHDWDAVKDCLHPDVVRIGPFGDAYTPRGAYLEYISALLPSLKNYTLAIHRTIAQESIVMVRLSETMEIGGSMGETHEVLMFDTDPAGLITHIDIFIQRTTMWE